jgi:chemotaxis protein MotB
VLAERVNRLERYRSEFFGRLRELLGDNPAVRVVGDRFVFQSELLFESGSARLGPEGRAELGKLADTLREVAGRIPEDIEWILRVDGHTDRVPIRTEQFASNWELSTARAVSVVRFLADQGIAQRRLAAAGFGEFHPIDPADTAEAYRRNRRIEIKLTSL